MALHNNPRVMAPVADTDASFFEQQQFRSTLYPQVYLEGNAVRGEDLEGTDGRNDELGAGSCCAGSCSTAASGAAGSRSSANAIPRRSPNSSFLAVS